MAPQQPSAMTMKRIHREIADLKKEDLGPITLAPEEDNLYLWKGSIPGPEGSVYEGGVFNVEVHLPTDYPFSSPKVLFKTRIYHMNISDSGNICIDILKHNWSPALSLFKVMLSLSSLLTDPNPKDLLVPSIATQYVKSRKVHDSTARQWTEMYARPPKPKSVAPPAPVAPTTSSSRVKGKRKAEPEPAGSSSRPSRTPVVSAEPVIVLDSDDEDASAKTVAKGKRKRAEDRSPAVNGAVLDLVGDEDDVADSTSHASRSSRTKRRRSDRTAAVNMAEGEDVIVIED
ncbi:ubiquitin-conjugating enzyme/RWD-like protein [Crucibulum laeve]|uniref:E2 ubiquitin-conjugating enzyme n=1 Tax=Crucibulum laeve TaxID=68775 RepID=A0A5C3LI42_9AGAR|nr:ubiquitin-conjugating enzyme/RWD-like protein [Crucibulum laeve]